MDQRRSKFVFYMYIHIFLFSISYIDIVFFFFLYVIKDIKIITILFIQFYFEICIFGSRHSEIIFFHTKFLLNIY